MTSTIPETDVFERLFTDAEDQVPCESTLDMSADGPKCSQAAVWLRLMRCGHHPWRVCDEHRTKHTQWLWQAEREPRTACFCSTCWDRQHPWNQQWEPLR